MDVLGQGAEAVITKQEDCTVLKHRISKEYRHPAIDVSLRRFRTRREAKIFGRLAEIGFPAPKLLQVDDSQMKIVMEFIDGKKVSDILEQKPELAAEIGRKIGILHSNGIVHGDLTTSNMILSDEVYFVDFGLSQFSLKPEDKAVDLHLFDRALESRHFTVYEPCIKEAFESYKKSNSGWQEVFARLEKVEKRGRNRQK